ncbi:sugar phosphate isomerase/epimerase [Ruminococcus sp. OA3]|uniref:sugar phosphate isomerase/epimerase family protein n=1 Tax=Ruminococcus sp. OA3 TaxID=2914164 RepID=UPI001F05DE8A|nr:sugar phosphate isomerase/epimerase family protein [Ruminococcus sp. OA3]MCH1981710.1 sugar phosphate isomerase/epimerase [Ruminococcus sp. OA3]
MRKNAISLQSSAVGRANLCTYIHAAQAAGFDCIEPTKVQLEYFFNAGYTPGDARMLLGDMEVSAVGWLSDIERQGYEFVAMMREAERLFETASSVGSQAVEIINGPVDWHAADCYRRGIPFNGYMGLQGLPVEEQRSLMIKNLQALADLAAQFKLTLFFEPLCWTPIPSLKEGIPLVEQAGRDNLKIVVDFYHNFISGVDAEFLSQINKNIILGVHVCNSREPDERVPCEEIFRDAAFYDGAVPIRDWVHAVKSTGFDGWWAYETFSKREAEADVYEFTKYVYAELKKLIED